MKIDVVALVLSIVVLIMVIYLGFTGQYVEEHPRGLWEPTWEPKEFEE